eukprot:2278434-Rhodomonas_salina.1
MAVQKAAYTIAVLQQHTQWPYRAPYARGVPHLQPRPCPAETCTRSPGPCPARVCCTAGRGTGRAHPGSCPAHSCTCGASQYRAPRTVQSVCTQYYRVPRSTRAGAYARQYAAHAPGPGLERYWHSRGSGPAVRPAPRGSGRVRYPAGSTIRELSTAPAVASYASAVPHIA